MLFSELQDAVSTFLCRYVFSALVLELRTDHSPCRWLLWVRNCLSLPPVATTVRQSYLRSFAYCRFGVCLAGPNGAAFLVTQERISCSRFSLATEARRPSLDFALQSRHIYSINAWRLF